MDGLGKVLYRIKHSRHIARIEILKIRTAIVQLFTLTIFFMFGIDKLCIIIPKNMTFVMFEIIPSKYAQCEYCGVIGDW